MGKKIFFFDLDGTLLTTDKKISLYNFNNSWGRWD